MRVLVACEYSGVVRDAFLALGHDAYSCDILPSDSKHPESAQRHFQEDIFQLLARDSAFDLMIAHPPCTYLSSAGNGHMCEWRRLERLKAAKFFRHLHDMPIKRVCLENPVGWLNTHYRKPEQIVQPHFFGDSEVKKTCLWLKNLPKLAHTNELPRPAPRYIDASGKKRYFTDAINRTGYKLDSRSYAKLRSRFWPGIAAAMAAQRGKLA